MAPDVEGIHQELKRVGVTLHLLWEEYREANPKGYAYSQFCEIYRRWAQKLKPSMRQVHRAGEKTFIDFSGKRPQLTDPHTGEAALRDGIAGKRRLQTSSPSGPFPSPRPGLLRVDPRPAQSSHHRSDRHRKEFSGFGFRRTRLPAGF